MQPSFARKLSLHICKTNVDTQKIRLPQPFPIIFRLCRSFPSQTGSKVLKVHKDQQLHFRFSQQCFVCKSDSNFCLYINHQRLNNLTIRNWYPLSLINKFLNRRSQAKQFTSLDPTSTYHLMRVCKKNKYKMVFCTRYNYFKYWVMPFGLFNA